MKSLIIQVNKFGIFIKLIFISYSCSVKSKKDEFVSFLTNNSEKELWDCFYTDSLVGQRNDISYLFYKDGRCEIYTIGISKGERYAQYSDRPEWGMLNDSVIAMLCYDKYKILLYSNDSIFLKKLEDPGIDRIYKLYRVKGDWNINKENIIRRDTLYTKLEKLNNPCIVY
ncbi:hypothetical protein [Myroides sp. LJL116]